MNTLIRAVLLFCCFGFVTAASYGQAAVDRKPLDAAVDKALAGYNAADAKVFFADYAKMSAAMATPATFDILYKGNLQTLGKYVSREPIAAQSVLTGDTGLLVYQAAFEKNKKVKISVNFLKEDGAFKIIQIQMAPM